MALAGHPWWLFVHVSLTLCSGQSYGKLSQEWIKTWQGASGATRKRIGGVLQSKPFPVPRSPFPESSRGSFKHHDRSSNTFRETGDGRRATGNVALRDPASNQQATPSSLSATPLSVAPTLEGVGQRVGVDDGILHREVEQQDRAMHLVGGIAHVEGHAIDVV